MNAQKYQPTGYAIQMGDIIEERFRDKVLRTMKVTRFASSSAICDFTVNGVDVKKRFPRTVSEKFRANGAGHSMSYRVLA